MVNLISFWTEWNLQTGTKFVVGFFLGFMIGAIIIFHGMKKKEAGK